MNEVEKIKVENMLGNSGRPVANQFRIVTPNGVYFQSYNTLIAVRHFGKVFLDKDSWDYSRTTGKYRNMFLGETKKETEAKIKSGEYELVDLNGGV
jgi:hypothetical protein